MARIDVTAPRESELFLFNKLANQIDATYDAYAQIGVDKPRVQSIELGHQYKSFTLFKTQDGLPFGLKVEKPNCLQKIFGIKACVAVMADLPQGQHSSIVISRGYSLRNTDERSVDSLVKNMAKNLDDQHKTRCGYLGPQLRW